MDIILTGDAISVLYTNIGSNLLPQYDSGRTYPFRPWGEAADLDGDGYFDLVEGNFEFAINNKLGYIKNLGSNGNPIYEPEYGLSRTSSELEQCNNSFFEFADANRNDITFPGLFQINNIELIDIDGDGDLDLFANITLTEPTEWEKPDSYINVFCENVGSITSPLFAPGVKNAFGLIGLGDILFSDMDDDGDKDAWVGTTFYDNVGNTKEPFFQHYDNLRFHPQDFETLFDINGDGRIDSSINYDTRLIYNSHEPATDIITPVLPTYYNSFITTIRPSGVQLETSNTPDFIVLPNPVRQLSLAAADFTGNNEIDTVLAMIDAEGFLKIEISIKIYIL